MELINVKEEEGEALFRILLSVVLRLSHTVQYCKVLPLHCCTGSSHQYLDSTSHYLWKYKLQVVQIS